MYRQGDVFIKEVNDIPEDVEKVLLDNDRIVLAYGEATGHAHAIKDKNAIYFFDKLNNKFYLLITKPVELIHEEHSAIKLPVGKFEVIRQRIYSPQEIRNVAD